MACARMNVAHPLSAWSQQRGYESPHYPMNSLIAVSKNAAWTSRVSPALKWLAEGLCRALLRVSLPLALNSCTEKTEVAMVVLRNKAENKLLTLAGEGEVAIELHRQQYAALKERLVRLKTLLALHRDSLDRAYAQDDALRIQRYSDLVIKLSERIGPAEKALKEGFLILEAQQEEIRKIEEEISSTKATSMLSESLEVDSGHQKRSETLRNLNGLLREKLRRVESLIEVNALEEKFSDGKHESQ